MSADEWWVCPICMAHKLMKEQKKREKLNDSYGKVSQEDFLRMKKELEDEQDKGIGQTVSQYGGIHLDAKTNTISIHSDFKCTKCSAHLEINEPDYGCLQIPIGDNK